jgi:hypothetical protein
MERIEQEMRIQPCPQRLEFGRRCRCFPLRQVSLGAYRAGGGGDGAVDHQAARHLPSSNIAQEGRGCPGIHAQRQKRDAGGPGEAEDRRRGDMCSQGTLSQGEPPNAPAQGDAGHCDHQRRGNRLRPWQALQAVDRRHQADAGQGDGAWHRE